MWRRVSCEQPLDTSQSILRLSGSIVQWRGESFYTCVSIYVFEMPRPRPKGKQVLIPVPGCVTVRGPRFSNVATRTELETPARTLGRVVFSA